MEEYVPPPLVASDPTPIACDGDQKAWSGLCQLTSWLADWLGRTHNRLPQSNPVASEPTDQQTGDHILPTPVVTARLSLHLFHCLCFDGSLYLWKDLSPLIAVRESANTVISWMLFYE